MWRVELSRIIFGVSRLALVVILFAVFGLIASGQISSVPRALKAKKNKAKVMVFGSQGLKPIRFRVGHLLVSGLKKLISQLSNKLRFH